MTSFLFQEAHPDYSDILKATSVFKNLVVCYSSDTYLMQNVIFLFCSSETLIFVFCSKSLLLVPCLSPGFCKYLTK